MSEVLANVPLQVYTLNFLLCAKYCNIRFITFLIKRGVLKNVKEKLQAWKAD